MVLRGCRRYFTFARISRIYQCNYIAIIAIVIVALFAASAMAIDVSMVPGLDLPEFDAFESRDLITPANSEYGFYVRAPLSTKPVTVSVEIEASSAFVNTRPYSEGVTPFASKERPVTSIYIEGEEYIFGTLSTYPYPENRARVLLTLIMAKRLDQSRFYTELPAGYSYIFERECYMSDGGSFFRDALPLRAAVADDAVFAAVPLAQEAHCTLSIGDDVYFLTDNDPGVASVPEPGTLAILVACGVGCMRRRWK